MFPFFTCSPDRSRSSAKDRLGRTRKFDALLKQALWLRSAGLRARRLQAGSLTPLPPCAQINSTRLWSMPNVFTKAFDNCLHRGAAASDAGSAVRHQPAAHACAPAPSIRPCRHSRELTSSPQGPLLVLASAQHRPSLLCPAPPPRGLFRPPLLTSSSLDAPSAGAAAAAAASQARASPEAAASSAAAAGSAAGGAVGSLRVRSSR